MSGVTAIRPGVCRPRRAFKKFLLISKPVCIMLFEAWYAVCYFEYAWLTDSPPYCLQSFRNGAGVSRPGQA